MIELFDRVLYGIDIPILTLGNRVGKTGYIDFIRSDEMPYPIMRGIDIYNRSFIAIKIQLNDDNKTHIVGTFFQRHTECKNDWAFGTRYYEGFYIYYDSRVSENHYDWVEKRLIKLIRGEILNNIDMYQDQECNNYIMGNGYNQFVLAH